MGRPRWTTVLVVCAVALMPIIVLWCMDLHLAAHFTSQPGKRSGGAMPKVAQTTRLASVLARRRTDDRSSDPSRPWPSTLHASNTTPSPLYKRHGAHALIASDTLQQGGQEARQRNFHSVHEVEVSSKDVSLPGGFKYVAASTGPSTFVVPRDRPRGGYFVEPPPVVSKVSDFRRASYIPYPKAELVLVTAASENHARVAVCLVRSIRRVYPDPASFPVVVYDLGMHGDHAGQIASLGAEVRRFNFSAYPAWWNVEVKSGEYAWKPEVVFEVVRESLVPVVWFDAGDLLKKPLDDVVGFARKYGLWIMHAPGFEPMAEFVHHDAIRFMEQLDASHPIRQASPRYRHDTKMPMAATGFFVVDPLHELSRVLIWPWRQCAHIRVCLAPIGSTKARGGPAQHRQDQSAMAMLVNWKFPQYWALKALGGKRPVRIHQDKNPCKSSQGR